MRVHSRIEGKDSLKSYRQLMVAGEGRAFVSSGVNIGKMPMSLGYSHAHSPCSRKQL